MKELLRSSSGEYSNVARKSLPQRGGHVNNGDLGRLGKVRGEKNRDGMLKSKVGSRI